MAPRTLGVGVLRADPIKNSTVQKLVVDKLVKKLPAFHGIRRFIVIFIKTRYWKLF